MKRYNLTQEELKYLYLYETKTGEFFRLLRNNKKPKLIKPKFDINTGWAYINVKNNFYYLHDLAYLYVLGVFPNNRVEYKNKRKHDISWENIYTEALPISLAKLSHKELKTVIRLADEINLQRQRK